MRSSGSRARAVFAILVVATLVFAAGAVYESPIVQHAKVSTTTLTLVSTNTVTSNFTVTVTSDAYLVDELYANHLLTLGSRNVSALVSEYEDNATIQWKGATNGIGGNYTGAEDIRDSLNYFIWGLPTYSNGASKPTGTSVLVFSVGNESKLTTMVIPGMNGNQLVRVNSTFDFRGNDIDAGNFNGTISARTTFTPGANDTSWLISDETWTFLSYWVQNPCVLTKCGF